MAEQPRDPLTQATLAAHFALVDPVIAALIERVGPSEIIDPDHPRRSRPPFESLARAIANQQLNSKVAARILERFVALYASDEFPSPQQVIDTPDAQLRAVGFSFAKVTALKDLAAKTISGVVPPPESLGTLADDAIIERLVAVRGVGRWTAEMLLLFQLGRPDVLPADDFGVRNGFRLAYGLKGMPQVKALLAFGERWRPHRSAAAWYLWRALDLHRAGKLPKRAGRAPRIAVVAPKLTAAKNKRVTVVRKARGKVAARRVSKPAPRPRRAGPKRRPPARSPRRR